MSQFDVGSGVLLDRTVFAAVNVEGGADSLQATYEFTLPAGSWSAMGWLAWGILIIWIAATFIIGFYLSRWLRDDD